MKRWVKHKIVRHWLVNPQAWEVQAELVQNQSAWQNCNSGSTSTARSSTSVTSSMSNWNKNLQPLKAATAPVSTYLSDKLCNSGQAYICSFINRWREWLNWPGCGEATKTMMWRSVFLCRIVSLRAETVTLNENIVHNTASVGLGRSLPITCNVKKEQNELLNC